MRVKVATLAAAFVLVVLLANCWWVGILSVLTMAQVSPPGRPPAHFAFELPGFVKFLVKLDHFSVDYGYVLIPFAWIVAFLLASMVLGPGSVPGLRKNARAPKDRPGDF